MEGRHEFTREASWGEFLAITDRDACAVGFGNRYVVKPDGDDRLVVEKDTRNSFRAVRGFARSTDGSVVTQTHVYEREMGNDDVDFSVAVLQRGECSLADGVLSEAAGTSCRHRYVMRRTFPDQGLILALFAGMDLPGVGGRALPDGYFGEVDLAEEGCVLAMTFMYAKVARGEPEGEGRETYVLSSCGEIQEKRERAETLDGEVDFDALDYQWRSEQLPGVPADWLPGGGWAGRTSRLEVEVGGMWASEGDVEWRPPDLGDESMVLVLTAGEAYFWGPREIVPAGEGGPGAELVFQAGRRVSRTAFQRVVWRYNGSGRCTRIDHELFSKKEGA